MNNFVFFTLIYAWLTNKINAFASDLMGRVMTWVAGIALVLVTLWILITGYRIMTGQLREPLMAVVANMARIVVIISVATSMSIFGANLNTFLTSDLSNEINQVVSGSSDSVVQDIDKNLALTEVAMSAIDSVQLAHGVAADPDTANDKNRASLMTMLGTAGPPMTAAVMLLMYQFTIALFIGLGPLFILCLIFEQTKSLFHKWLMYGIGTLFSLAVLNVVTSMVLQLSTGVAAGMWAATLIPSFTPGMTEGLSHQALEQGGIGMLLTLLIITVPPMTANFFQGTLGGFMHYSAFNPSSGSPGPQGQPPGSPRAPSAPSQANTGTIAGNNGNSARWSGNTGPTPVDGIKSGRPNAFG
ncbi:type IV secretion system protein [Dyella psychrodurans]|uniref:Type VI secretion protein n=1 Tax=Dyella psychrodurans TaxID=1927960 RepID=A0A370X521_9GAMM|nr:type IV secretion system protein [Dyella psychrodurans]RDS83377.1 type VI secretion protein [Dyella psychrodurans]